MFGFYMLFTKTLTIMCGRFTLTKKQKEITERFNAEIEGLIQNIFNAAPTQDLPVISDINPAKIAFLKWGLVPSWAKEMEIGNKLINARAETLSKKPAFRKLIDSQRCLIPADGFYEWKSTPYGKQPYRIILSNDDLFSFAGLWDQWQNPAGLLVYSFTIITTEPNDLIKNIHNRMPVILNKENEQEWLDQNVKSDRAISLLKPFPSEKMRCFPVSKAVNNVANNSPELILEIPDNRQLTLF